MTWKMEANAARCHVVSFGMSFSIPTGLCIEAQRKLACYICRRYPAKVFMLTYTMFDPAFLETCTWVELKARVVEIVKHLPVNEKFILFDSSGGNMTWLLWEIQDRLLHAVVVNAAMYLEPTFEDRASHSQLQDIAALFKRIHKERDLRTIKSFMSAMALVRREDASEKQRVWDEYFDTVDDCYWYFTSFAFSIVFEERSMCLQNNRLQCPVTLVIGDSSPDVSFGDSAYNLAKLMEDVKIQFIPNSKQSWELEGPDQIQFLGSVLGSILQNECGVACFDSEVAGGWF